MSPVTYDRYGHYVTGLSRLRERRLLQMAWHCTGHHKAHYSEYCFLMRDGLVQWSLGTAFLTEAGVERLARLIAEGV